MTLGPGPDGKDRSLKCVPIFRQEFPALSDEDVIRKQFPLTLAWALTHWKAQGMTLARARVALSKKTAKQPGIGFVAVTRVRHVRDLIFENDLPEWDEFQQAQYSPTFRMRQRFELRLRAKASTTLRKYGFCEADLWQEEEDTVLASRLLEGLQIIGDNRRRVHGKEGDDDAWLWFDERPDMPTLMSVQIEGLVRELGEQSRERIQTVGERLLGPYHIERVQEVLGCLIPPDLHWKFDKSKPKGKGVVGYGECGIKVKAGPWTVDIMEEQELREGLLHKGTMEMCLHALRRVCERLKLPAAIGTHKLGLYAAAADDVGGFRLRVRSWAQWTDLATALHSATELLEPVPLEDARVQRKCVLVRVAVRDGAASLVDAKAFTVTVWDPIAKRSRSEELAKKLVGLICSAKKSEGSVEEPLIDVEVPDVFPACRADYDVGVAVFGMLVGRVAELAGVASPLVARSPAFVQDASMAFAAYFAHVRTEAVRTADRDILNQLRTEDLCRRHLQIMAGTCHDVPPRDVGMSSTSAAAVSCQKRTVPLAQREVFTVLTWNVSGGSVSVSYTQPTLPTAHSV